MQPADGCSREAQAARREAGIRLWSWYLAWRRSPGRRAEVLARWRDRHPLAEVRA